MLHWKIEGQEIRQGLSIYRPSDKNSAGGCLRIKNHLWIARFSKWTKKFHFSHHKSNPIIMGEWPILPCCMGERETLIAIYNWKNKIYVKTTI